MINRNLSAQILQSLNYFPVIGIIGSRQVGKTTLAKQISKLIKKKSIYLDLELPSDLNKLRSPELYFREHEDRLIIIDEIQRKPELFPLLRAIIDQKRVNGRFLLLGSASPSIMTSSSESLAGRIVYHTLYPLNLEETNSLNTNKLWLRGGYPESFLAKKNAVSFQWRESFLKTHLERDLPQLGIRVPFIKLYRFLLMLCHSHGQLLNMNKLANSLDITAPTIQHYLDIFESTFIIRKLYPHFANLKKRLIKSPKIYIQDSGLLHSLVQIQDFEQLQANPLLGASWEGFVIEQVCSSMPTGWEISFFRTNAGAEIDLLLCKQGQSPIAIEIKYSLSPTLSRGFWNAYKDLACRKGLVIYPGDESYPIKDSVSTLPIKDIPTFLDSLE